MQATRRRLLGTALAAAGYGGAIGGLPSYAFGQSGDAVEVDGEWVMLDTVEDTIECVDARLLLPVVRAHQATLARLIAA